MIRFIQFLAIFLIQAHIAHAQIPTVGTNGVAPTPQPIDMNQLPPEVRNLLPQNQQQAAPVQAQPRAVMPSAPYTPPEVFPASQQPSVRQNQRYEAYVPSEVISVLPPVAKSGELRAVLRTSVGDITIKLDRLRAPQTVAQFVGLAKGEKEFIDVKTSKRTKRPFYNGLTFHRVSKGYLIQTGCPFGTGRGTAGEFNMLKDEIRPGTKFNKPGLVAMAPQRDGTGMKNVKDTNSSQFFITLREIPDWDDQFTVFGEVEDGMDVVEKIAAVKVGPTERPIKRVYLVAVDIIEDAAK